LCFLALLSLFYSQFAFVVFAQEQDSQNTTMLAQEALIDLNSADAQTLAAALSGVGLVKAQEIIRYRETYGDFVAIEELAEVKGIGQTLLERNRHRLQPLRKVSKNE
jgi:competence protein ComEA